MVKLNAHFDGKVFVPDEPPSLAPNQKVRISVEPIEDTARNGADRVPGRQRGALIWMSPDFNKHLGDEFWGLSDPK